MDDPLQRILIRGVGLSVSWARVALAWAEALTNIAASHASDSDCDAAHRISDEELVALSIGVAMINVWNGLAAGDRLSADNKRAA
jgi:alkylhydroperoxidase family enzyme